MEEENRIYQGNGDIPHVKDADANPASTFQDQIKLLRIKNQAQELRKELLKTFTQELDAVIETFVTEIDHIQHVDQNKDTSFSHISSSKKREKGELPDKTFHARRSVLTDLFEISHVKTIYHMFVAILIVFSLNTIVYDCVNEGRLNLNFELIQWALGRFPKVMSLWVSMQLCTLVIVYPVFNYWATQRTPGKIGWMDILGLCLYIAYQTAFFIYPVYYSKEHSLPPGSIIVVTCEQLRLMMKVHAFVRENVGKVLRAKKDDDDKESTEHYDFSKYLYFLFIPTLVYRDQYPRTKTINWNYVVSNFAQVLGCLFYTYYIFERFCVPVFQNFGREHVTPNQLLVSVFGSMLPGTLVLFLGFFGVLHSWFNAFAEMLRFADRQFYKDWWNSTSFSNFYRTWNIVVHDWLYSYVYKDFLKVLGPKNKAGAMALVFLISAIFHEYVLIVTFDFFYPVLFVMFMGAGFGFIFIKDDGSRPWNVFLWVSLFIGNGLLMCLYSMEWYARKSCPVTTDNFLDYLIPRSWTCNFEAIAN